MKKNKSLAHIIAAVVLLALFSAGNASALIVYKLSYQGRLTDAGGATVADGPHTVSFTIYDQSTGGTALWSSGSQTVTTTDGLFTYELGSNVLFPFDLFDGALRYLGITVGADPELSPRTQLNSSAYAMHAIKADISGFADNSDLLDGKNSTAFVDKAGDVMSGSLGFANGTTPMTYIYQSGTSNASRPIIAHSPAFPDWGLLYDDLTDEFLFAAGSVDTNLIVDMNGVGDNAIRLNNDAISAPEILDEPGIAQGFAGNITALGTTIMTDLITVTITIPKSGYIYLQGHTTIGFSGTTSQNIAEVQIDENAGGGISPGYYTTVGLSSYSGTDIHLFSCSTQRTYFKSAGTYTFRLEAVLLTGSATAQSTWPILTATYFPSSYGTVQTVSPSPAGDPHAKAVQISDPTGNGNVTTAYQVDLRALELKARKEREEALQAELELERARNQRDKQ